MKLAVIYSGTVRYLPELIENHRAALLDRYDCDVYFHFWDIYGKTASGVMETVSVNELPLTNEEKNRIVALLNPKAYRFESTLDTDEYLSSIVAKFIDVRANTRNSVGMFYSMYEAQNLFTRYASQHNITYDGVVRIRPDLDFVLNNDTYITLPPPEPNTLYIMSPDYHRYSPDNLPGISDQLGMGTSEVMTIYNGVFEELVQRGPDPYATPTVLHPEDMVLQRIRSHNISVVHTQPIHYTIRRVA